MLSMENMTKKNYIGIIENKHLVLVTQFPVCQNVDHLIYFGCYNDDCVFKLLNLFI